MRKEASEHNSMKILNTKFKNDIDKKLLKKNVYSHYSYEINIRITYFQEEKSSRICFEG